MPVTFRRCLFHDAAAVWRDITLPVFGGYEQVLLEIDEHRGRLEYGVAPWIEAAGLQINHHGQKSAEAAVQLHVGCMCGPACFPDMTIARPKANSPHADSRGMSPRIALPPCPGRPRWLLAVLLVLVPVAAGAAEPDAAPEPDTPNLAPGPATYHAPGTSGLQFGDPALGRWTFLRGDDGTCELQRKLNAYGTARFHAADTMASLRFELATAAGMVLPAPVSLRREAPPWHPQYPVSQTQGYMRAVDGFGMWADAEQARRMLMDLYNGFDQVLYADGAFDANSMFRIRLAADHFRASYRRFQACVRQRDIVHGFANLDRSRVHFPTDDHRLDAAAREQVATLARFVRADTSVQRIFVDGHTDASGGERHNVALSRRRAESVVQVLTGLGVSQRSDRHALPRAPIPGGQQRQRVRQT